MKLKKAKKYGLNVLDFNICSERCDCGWNIRIGGIDRNALFEIEDILRRYGYNDMTDHSKKINCRRIFHKDK